MFDKKIQTSVWIFLCTFDSLFTHALEQFAYARACTAPAWVFVLGKIRHSGAAQALGWVDA